MVEEPGKGVYFLHSGAITLQQLWNLMNRMDGCCMDSDEDRLRFMEEATKMSWHTGR